MNLRCLRTFLLGGVLAGALTFLGAPTAHAVGETPTVDGDLTDLIAAVNANLGSDKGGFAFTDPPSDVFTGTCAYVNGYDIVKSYAYFRLKNGSGAYTPNDVTLYLGWEVTGQIGDVDGDGNADTFDSGGPGTGCALSDGGGNTGCASGIGVGESYSILLNLNCSGADDLRLGVSNNKVGILTAGGDLQTEIAGGVFCRVGHFLELSIPHYENLLKAPALVAIGATLCQANLRMVANAGDDLLAEDTTPVQQLRVPGSITITKTPASQDACPGTNVSWTIQVCNNGICPFATVTVSDTLDAGLTYVSDNKGSVQGANPQIRVWTFSNMNPGDCQTINLTSKVDFPCAAAVLNNKVGVEAVEPASPCTQFAEAATAHASAVVNCKQPNVNIIKGVSPSPINPGGTTTVTLTIQNTGNSVLDPINVCDKLDAGVSFDAAQAIGGTCGVTLLSNTLNGDGTRSICFTPFSLPASGSCTITYKVGCVTSGVHPDTANVTAFCQGETENPVRDRDQSSFTCACPADVEIGKQVNPPSVNPGQDVTVTLTISNPGSTVLDPINVCDKLDAGVSFDASQTIGGTCGVTLNSNTLNGDGTRTICFTPFSLNPGASCTITYKVRCVTSGVHPDTATVIGQCKGGGESDRDQDQAHSSFSCACPPDVEIGKVVSPPNVTPGQDVTVTLTISNPGQTVLDPINVCDKLDAGVSFDAAQTIGGTCGVTLNSNTLNGDGTRTLCFSPFSLNPGTSCTITYKVRCVTSGTHPDTATVVAQCKDGGEQDKDTDRAQSSFTCACPPDVEIGKQVSPPSVGTGEQVTVTLTISNPGTTVLDPINVCDKLDAGVSFDAAQVIGGTCNVTLASNTLNGDGTRTICFTPFSLNPGASCTIQYKVACVNPGTHPDTATVVAQCKNGGEQDKDTDRAQSSFICLGGGSCPRTVGYWAAQCAQKGNGSTKFSKDNVNKIAECIDGKVQIFSWPGGGFNAFDGFCAIITPDKPMNCKKQALRQFAGLLANACVGELKILAANGDSVFLNLSDPSPCKDFGPTLGDLISGIDAALVQLKNENADPQDPRYCAIVECADGINNGRTIRVAPGCSEGTGTTGLNRGTTGGELGLDSFDAGSIPAGKVELYKPMPNPFANSTEIAYAVGGTGESVQIGIYDVAGRLVRSLVHEFRAPGQYQVSWNGQDEGGRSVAHGVYFLRAFVGGQRMDAGASRILYLR